MTTTVAFDESGNSGANLLDPEQPVFVLASVHVSNEKAAEVLGSAGKEIKFSKLRNSGRGRRRILEILNSVVLSENDFVLSGLHKPFIAITKIVDLLVEPMLYDAGIDLYERGANLAMANMLYFAMPAFIGREAFEAIQVAFVEMVREPSVQSVDRFFRLLKSAKRKDKQSRFARELDMLLATRPVAEEYLDCWDSSFLDPAIPAFVQQGSIWTGRLNSAFAIIHDSSKPIQQQQVILEAMMSTTEQVVEIGYDRRKRVFPIKALGIEFHDSSTCLPLQVADVLAGSAAYVLRATILRSKDSFYTDLLATRALSRSFQPVWPELKFTPEELGTTEIGGVDSNNYVGEYVARRLGGIPLTGSKKKK